MKKWHLAARVCSNIAAGGVAHGELLWEKKDKKTGRTEWDDLIDLAAHGWELVSVTPIAVGYGYTAELLFVFRRPIEED